MKRIKSVHGHFSNTFEEEVKKIIENYKRILNIDITWTEATAIAAMRSSDILWNEKKLKDSLARIRGL